MNDRVTTVTAEPRTETRRVLGIIQQPAVRRGAAFGGPLVLVLLALLALTITMGGQPADVDQQSQPVAAMAPITSAELASMLSSFATGPVECRECAEAEARVQAALVTLDQVQEQVERVKIEVPNAVARQSVNVPDVGPVRSVASEVTNVQAPQLQPPAASSPSAPIGVACYTPQVTFYFT